jgi:SmpA / OmlA family
VGINRFVPATGFTLYCIAASVGYCGNDVPKPAGSSPVVAISAQKLAQLTPGVSTKAQVQSLLGAPWRTVQYNDLDELENEIWEYRGTDAKGSYRIHIEFDHHDVAQIVGKIPDITPGGNGTTAKAASNN